MSNRSLDLQSNETVALALPSSVSSAIDQWWQDRFGRSHALRATPMVKLGLSSATVWLVEPMDISVGSHGQLALKNWNWTAERFSKLSNLLAFQEHLHQNFKDRLWIDLHSNQSHRSDNLNSFRNYHAPIVPEIFQWPCKSTILVANQTLWTLCRWLPGKHLEPGSFVSDELFYNAIQTLKALHAFGITFGTKRDIAPGIKYRYDYLLRWVEGSLSKTFLTWSHDFLRKHATVAENRVALVERLSRHLAWMSKKLFPQLRQEMAELSSFELPLHWICGDLWRENILVDKTEQRITGIVDFGAARCDWPILEVIRLFASWLNPEDIRWEIVNESFSSSLPSHSCFTLKQIDQIATVTAWLYWLEQLSSTTALVDIKVNNQWRRLEELNQRLQNFYGEM